MKNAIPYLLALLLLLSALAGCTSAPQSDNNPASTDGNASSPLDTDLDTVIFWIPDFGTDVTDVKDVEAAINAITTNAIGVQLVLHYISVGDYGTQLSLAVVNGEQIDLALYTPVDSSAWLNFYANGVILDISDLLDAYCPALKDLIGEDILSVNSVDGAIYGLSNYRQLNSNTYLCYRTDVLEQAGVLDTFKSMTSWDTFESVLLAITENCGNVYAIGGAGDQPVTSDKCVWGTGSFSDAHSWDALGDTLNVIYTDQEGHVSNAFQQQDMIDTYKMVADWYQKGYVYPDSAISADASEVMIMQKVYAGSCVDSEYGVEANKTQACGTDMTCIEVVPGRISTDEMRKLGMFIPSSSKEPEAAAKLLNLIYTNSEIMNLLVNGIEGTHYTVTDGLGSFPAGKDISSCGYHTYDFLLGNQFLCVPWEGSQGGADFRDAAYADFLAAPKSVYCGLTVDTSGLNTVIAALSSVKDEYYFQIANGQYTDEIYAEFLAKQEAAGAAEYVSLYQAAVDAFLD